MNFGAIIAVKQGVAYVPIEAELEGALAEIRVEQHLDEPTSFALLFQEDFEGDEPKITNNSLFTKSTELAILVPDGPESKELVCLVRGVVEQVSFDVELGGTGSSFSARGHDVRTLLTRKCDPGSFTETTSGKIIEQLAEALKASSDLEVCVAQGDIRYDIEAGGPAAFNFVGTPLEMIEALVSQESLCVWLDYEVLSPTKIVTTLNVRSSPYRGEVLIGCPLPSGPPRPPRPDIEVLVRSDKRPNVVTFSVDSENDPLTEAKGHAIDASGGESAPIAAQPSDDKYNDGDLGGEDTGNEEETKRSCFGGGPGGPTEINKKSEAKVNEASWFVEAELLTSASLYRAVLVPHQEVKVTGVGCAWTGKYQVADVTHVINAAEHWMTATLRTNSRGKKKSV